MDECKLFEMLAKIQQQLAMIATQVQDLAKVARSEHPDMFSPNRAPASVRRDPATPHRS